VDLTTETYRNRQRALYLRRRRRQQLLESLRTPLSSFHETPVNSVAVTIPLAAAAVAVVLTSTEFAYTRETFLADPLVATAWLVVLPFLVVTVPLTIFVERQNARQNRISRSFPDTLNALSSANRMGVGTTDALELVAKWSSGPIGRELRMVRNDIQWNHDTARALRAFADRLHVPQLSRSMKLVAEGMQSSSDLAKVLRIAAEDTRNRFRIEQQRRRELSSYVAVVVIGYLVYLLVVALLTTSYLEPVQAASEAAGPAAPDAPQAPVSLTTLPVAAYELLFIHSAIIQAVGSGLIAGKLVENRALSGLKYSVGLVVVALIAFSLL
jgi:flagellar protein FlaJ